jgi:hypothetical protein
MLDTLRRIAALQPHYNSVNTPEMRQRGELVRQTLAAELTALAPKLAFALGEFGEDFHVDASDGIGRKTEAPWARFCSRHMSPAPTNGFYAVIHFSADGSAFWLTVGCGSTIWNGNDLRALPDRELAERTGWARSAIVHRFGSTAPFDDQIALGARAKLPKTFEKATVVARRFPVETATEDSVVDGLEDCARFLREIYRAQAIGSDLSLAQVAEIELEEVARPLAGRRGQGIGLTAPERRAVELQAMGVAREWLEGLGYEVTDRSINAPFDFEARRDGAAIKVEVKGTTAMACHEFFMTRNEVELHRRELGATGLILVSQIQLDRADDGTCSASGGVCEGEIGWDIGRFVLEPMAYRVARPREREISS